VSKPEGGPRGQYLNPALPGGMPVTNDRQQSGALRPSIFDERSSLLVRVTLSSDS